MAEAFGVQGCGAFYDEVGAVRDVVQNHLLQVLANLAMESPVGAGSEALRDEKREDEVDADNQPELWAVLRFSHQSRVHNA